MQTALPSRVPGPWVPLTHYSQSSELKFVPEHSTIFEFQWNFLLVEYSCGAKRSVQRNPFERPPSAMGAAFLYPALKLWEVPIVRDADGQQLASGIGRMG